jgi:hypothetical protein
MPSEPIKDLRDRVRDWKRSGESVDNPYVAGAFDRCVKEVEALLPALEQRERELRLDEALKFQAALFDAEFVFKFAENRVAELRVALNPTEQKGAGVAPRRSRA